MNVLYHVVVAAIILQVLFTVQVIRNHRYVMKKFRKERLHGGSVVTLIVPCKGLDLAFERNISAFYALDYDNYHLRFVEADTSDPAYAQLCQLKDDLSAASKALSVEVLVAGNADCCSQKLHNMLFAYRQIGDDVDILAFADSDACVRTDWLSHIIHPLRQSKAGVASGYRWYVPQKYNMATLALSAINAKIAQLLGATHFNLAWGGSMAIRVDVFRRLAMEQIWTKAISDDLTISRAVKKAGMKVVFVPACLIASYDEYSWAQLFEFARRQFLITRVTMPASWLFGLLCSLYSSVGMWGGIALGVYAVTAGIDRWPTFIAMPVVFFIGQIVRAAMRQTMISKLLPSDADQMRLAARADVLGCCLWSPIMLFLIVSSALGRTIRWRGIRYKLLGPTETEILG